MSYHLSVCGIFQNEGPFLKEWIEYHRVVGVEHFYLYNDRSLDDFREVLQPFLERKIVELFNVDNNFGETFRAFQRGAYIEGLTRAKGRSKWVAVIDIDEFIVPKKEETVPEMLGKYSQFPGVIIRWQKFGTSGLQEMPPDTLQIEVLRRKSEPDAEDNHITKSILQPACIPPRMLQLDTVIEEDIDLIHFCKWKPLNERKVVKVGPLSFEGKEQAEIPLEVAQINHYWTRTENYLREYKVPRKARLQFEDFGTPPCWPEEKIQRYIQVNNKVEDLAIQRFVAKVKKAMKEKEKSSSQVLCHMGG